MAKNPINRLGWIMVILLTGFFVGTQFDSDPVGMKRHEEIVARTEAGITNGFIGLGMR